MSNIDTKNEILKRNIPFSPPDISELEIAEVAEALRSGWITTGPRTKELERRLAEYIERDTALSKEEIYRKIDVLRNACDTGDDLIAKEALRSVVPTFKTPEEVNKEIA